MSLFVLDNKNISKAIHLLHPNEELFEIRLINGNYNASGYFTNADTAIKALQDFRPNWNSRTPTAKAANIFITLNPIDMSCYARQQHDCFMENVQPTTKDNEITNLHWLLIDLDPKRMSGVSSSDKELQLAKDKAKVIHGFMSERGFKEPIRAMSGNGIHLVYRFDVPNISKNVSVFENALKVLSEKFSDDEVEVDTTVFNPARICKLWGTIAHKGANTPERLHRKAYIEPSVPSSIDVNDFTLLQALAAEFEENKTPEPIQTSAPTGRKEKFDLQQFISKYNIKKNLIYSNSFQNTISLSKALTILLTEPSSIFLSIVCLMKATRERTLPFFKSLTALAVTSAFITPAQISIGKMSACCLNLTHTIKRPTKTPKEKRNCLSMTLTAQVF